MSTLVSLKKSFEKEFIGKESPITSELEIDKPKVELEVELKVINPDSQEPKQLNEKSNKSDDTMIKL